VRDEQSCFAARIVSVDSFLGSAPVIALKADSLGLEKGALRLAIYHTRTSFASSDERHLHVALLVKAASCKDDAGLASLMDTIRNAKVEGRVDGGAWHGIAHAGALKLELAEDPATRRPGSAAVNDQPVTTPVFHLNGKSMGLGAAGN